MDKQGYEQFLIGVLQDGFPGQLTACFKDTEKQSREERLEDEFCELLTTCAVFQSDPIRLQAAIRRHMVGIVNRLVAESNLPEYVESKEDRDRDHADWLYQERKDQELEKKSQAT